MPDKLDRTVFRDLSYGLYIVSASHEEARNAQIVNTVIQVTSQPARIAVIINKGNYTHEIISRGGVFGASVLSDACTLKFIGPFGFRSGRDVDKFAYVSYITGHTGCPLVTENCLSAAEARVVKTLDLGTHTVFVGDVEDTHVFGKGNPLTYRYYHEHLKGKSPAAAPSFMPVD